MELRGARVLVAGATGGLGSLLSHRLSDEGCVLALAGRDRERLSRLGAELDAPTARFEAASPASCETAVAASAAALEGLDAIVVTCGVAAFAPAGEVGPHEVDDLFAVNALGPIALIEAALHHMGDDGTAVAISAIVARYPTAGIAHYSAAKAALSAYLAALRRERIRAGATVIDVRPPHLDTGFSSRPLFGEPRGMPEPIHAEVVADATVAAMRDGRREVAWDLKARSLITG